MSGILNVLLAVGGGGSGTVTIGNVNWNASSGASSSSGYELLTDGNIRRITNGSNSDAGDWIAPLGAAPGLYEARATVTSGAISTGPASGVWTAISAGTCQWTRLRTNPPDGSGTTTLIFTLDIRYNGGAIIATATITLSATIV